MSKTKNNSFKNLIDTAAQDYETEQASDRRAIRRRYIWKHVREYLLLIVIGVAIGSGIYFRSEVMTGVGKIKEKILPASFSPAAVAANAKAKTNAAIDASNKRMDTLDEIYTTTN